MVMWLENQELSMDHELVAYEVIGAVARIYLNRPEKRNAQNTRLLDELDAALRRAEEDPSIRVVILGANGDHFSAGHDLRELGDNYLELPSENRYAYEEKYFYKYALRIWDLPKPVIAQVQGACVAGGFLIAAMCDFLVVSEDAFFADNVVPMGSAGVEVLFHPWVLGPRLAKEILFTGRSIFAAEAKDIGLANRVVPRSDLESTVLALAEQIAKAPPFTVKLTKKSINRTMDIQGFRTAIEAHFDTHQLCHTTSESGAGGSTGSERLKNFKAVISKA